MNNAVVTLTKKLISFKSISDHPEELKKVLEVALSEVKGFTIERFEHKGKLSALVYNTKKRPKKFTMLLNAHLDVIPGKEFQYSPQVKDNRLYGVGALDMKANAAAMILTFKEVAKQLSYPVALQLTTDEELGGFDGTKYQIDKGVRADFVIAGETTNFNIVTKAKGILWMKILAKGTTAHGAYPWKGDNAIWKMQSFLKALEVAFPHPKKEGWFTTVNVAHIETTNKTFNKIPDTCEVWLDIRYTPEDAKTVAGKIKKLLPSGCTAEILVKEPALFTRDDNSYVTMLQKNVKNVIGKKAKTYGANGSSDARHYMHVGGQGVEFGAIGGGSGSDEEWIDIESLSNYTEILKAFLLSIS